MPADLDLLPFAEPAWIVATLGVAYDEEHERVIVHAHELFEEEEEGQREGEEPATASVHITREQAQAFVDRAKELMKGGRPPCPVWSGPMDPTGHVCPRSNAMLSTDALDLLTRGVAVKGPHALGQQRDAPRRDAGLHLRAPSTSPKRGERPLTRISLPMLYKRGLAFLSSPRRSAGAWSADHHPRWPARRAILPAPSSRPSSVAARGSRFAGPRHREPPADLRRLRRQQRRPEERPAFSAPTT